VGTLEPSWDIDRPSRIEIVGAVGVMIMALALLIGLLMVMPGEENPQADVHCMDIARAHGISCVTTPVIDGGMCECRDRHAHVMRFQVIENAGNPADVQNK
jgi:hypothetical protein